MLQKPNDKTWKTLVQKHRLKYRVNHKSLFCEFNEENTIGTFNQLNFDCLVHISSFLELNDLENLEKLSEKFKPIIEHSYKRYKSFDFKSISPVTHSRAKTVFKKIGPYLSSLKIDLTDFITLQKEYFSMYGYAHSVNLMLYYEDCLKLDYCTNLENIEVHSTDLGHEILFKMSKLFPRLKSIKFNDCDLGDDDSIGKYLETATVLKKLSYKNMDISGSCINKIKNLISFDLSCCRNISPNHFTDFCLNNKSLVKLDMVDSGLLTSISVNNQFT